jgi:hypothetical protein
MLHDLGYIESDIAVKNGYTHGLGSGRIKGKGLSLPDSFSRYLQKSGYAKVITSPMGLKH